MIVTITLTKDVAKIVLDAVRARQRVCGDNTVGYRLCEEAIAELINAIDKAKGKVAGPDSSQWSDY